MIREVIFDIDSTLYDYDSCHAEGMRRMEVYIQENFQISPEEFRKAYERHQAELTKRLGEDNAAIHSRTIRIQNMLEEWKKPLFPHVDCLYHAYWDTLLEASKPEPGVLDCIKALKAMGISIGIGTDMTAMMQYRKLESLGISPYVNHIVTSQEAGVEKPHPDFMALCIRKSGFRPEECLFVGDHIRKDVWGAAESGMYAVWYNAKGKARPKTLRLPEERCQEIHHFDELLSCVKAIK